MNMERNSKQDGIILATSPIKSFHRVSEQVFTRLAGCVIKSMRPIFKTEMLIYQLKANLDERILFGKITHL